MNYLEENFNCPYCFELIEDKIINDHLSKEKQVFRESESININYNEKKDLRFRCPNSSCKEIIEIEVEI